MSDELTQVFALLFIVVGFGLTLKYGWEIFALIFGLTLLVGSCEMLGI